MSQHPPPRRGPASALRAFLAHEAAGGLILIAATLAALVIANLPATAAAYAHLLHAETGPVLSPKLGPMTVHLWINDGLMALFFLLVGLEIRREFTDGELSLPAARRLPVIAAAAGMGVPAIVYLLIVGGDATLHRGWAIPAATDIAFAMGVLALLGRRAPASIKLLLTTIAIVDDLGAVAIIAIGYTDTLDWGALAGAGATIALLALLARRRVLALWPYLAVGVVLWLLVLRSGVHATVAGVILAAFIPVVRTPAAPDALASPVHRLEHALLPLTAFFIVPLFAFANAGVPLGAVSLAPLTIAIAAGLFVGKQAGIFGAIWAAVRLGVAPRPANAGWAQVYGMALLAGIGFTMSLFIGGLAFPGDAAMLAEVQAGVLAGSLLSALAGYTVLRVAAPR